MKYKRYICIVGDVHGGFDALNQFINTEIRQNKALWASVKDAISRIIILPCGDSAYYWPCRRLEPIPPTFITAMRLLLAETIAKPEAAKAHYEP